MKRGQIIRFITCILSKIEIYELIYTIPLVSQNRDPLSIPGAGAGAPPPHELPSYLNALTVDLCFRVSWEMSIYLTSICLLIDQFFYFFKTFFSKKNINIQLETLFNFIF